MMPPTYSSAERETLFAAATALMTGPDAMSLRRACESVGLAPGTYKLWQARMDSTWQDGRRTRSGRRAAVALSPGETAALQKWVLAKEGSFATAIEFFARDPECTPAVRDFIQARLHEARQARKAPKWPDSLRRAGQLPVGAADLYAGPKAVQHALPIGRYSLTVRLPGGQEVPLTPGFAWTFDDYSTNQPYQLEYAGGQFRLCRQVLCGMDVFTAGWLGHYHVGKERDAYTAADCLETMRLCIEGQGHQPRVFLLEQGRWKGNAIRGVEMENGARWGSVEEAGILLSYQWSSRGKGEIERGFDLLQTWLAGESPGIGRTRGHMERETTDMLAVNAGRRDPGACGFLTLTESADLHSWAMQQLNARPKDRRELGGAISADDLLTGQPSEPRPPDPAHRWLWFPHKGECTVRENGFAIVTIEGKEHVFHVNGVRDRLALPNRYRLYIAFDPDRPELGAHLANRETGAANAGGYRLGETLLPHAPALTAAPRIDLDRYRDDPDHAARDASASWKARKGATKAARTAYRTVLPGGKSGLRQDAARNRAGDRVEILSGADTTPAGRDAAPAAENTASNTTHRVCVGSEAFARLDTADRPETAANRLLTKIRRTVDLEALQAAEAELY